LKAILTKTTAFTAMEVVWDEHLTSFTDGFDSLQTTGKHDRIGMLLQKVSDSSNEFLKVAESIDAIQENESSVPLEKKEQR
jgi:hypothetical protein